VKGAAGRRLRSIEAYDILMWAAKAVLSGGVRRSATICLFSADDAEMASAKTGNWFEQQPQRTASNNSAVIPRATATRAQFDALFEQQKQYGEPGFYFVENEEYGANPCVEIGLHPRLTIDQPAIERLRELGHTGELRLGDTLTGVQFCNLSTISAAAAETPDAFYRLCAHAALIGTLQAGYSDFEYLSPISRLITEREALLGVSLCGVLDRPDVLLDAEVLRRGASIVKAVNAIVARALGIQPAARTTCVKPEGTASLLLGTSSGLHPHHARRYFRRVQTNVHDPIYNHFRRQNPQMVEPSVYDPNGRTEVITFPVEGPDFGIYREDLSAVKHLEYVRLVQENWVQAGRRHEKISPGLHHNVSCTISVRPDEWAAVADYIWSHRGNFTGVALLQDCGDKIYAQAPREGVVTPSDIAKWNRLTYQPVDYTALEESEDITELKQTVACAGGSCEVV
jgi:ribonucleoside-diphosphate reductase alpha chain